MSTRAKSTQKETKPPAATSPSRAGGASSNSSSGKVTLPIVEGSANVASSVASLSTSDSSSKINAFINTVSSAPLRYANGSDASSESAANTAGRALTNVALAESIAQNALKNSSSLPIDHAQISGDNSESSKADAGTKPMDVEKVPLVENKDLTSAQKKYAERELSFINPYSWQDHNRPVLRAYANARSRFFKYPSSRSSTYAQCNQSVTAALHAIKNTKALVEPFTEMHGSDCIVIYIDKEDEGIAEKAKQEILSLPAVKVLNDEGSVVNSLVFSDSFVHGPSPSSNVEKNDVFPIVNGRKK
mmetsp:Transcript_34173/g.55306  ORF Transcript_34173/g.55306 Transcript_34173/m.55306 type:complete len:303 (+) Transcript_34173:2-910(+)